MPGGYFLGRVIKVTDDVYAALDAIRREKGLRSLNAAVNLLLEGKIEKVTVSDSKPTEPVSGEKSGSDESIKRQLIELRAMIQKLLDLTEHRGGVQASQNPQNLAIEKCPYCGFKLQGNRVNAEILNVHLPFPRIGIEFNYLACPNCEKPLSEITWKPLQP